MTRHQNSHSAVARHIGLALNRASMTRGFAGLAALLVGLSLITTTETLIALRAREIASENSAKTLAIASELRARTDRELNSVLYLSSGIVGYLAVRHDQLDSEEINRILETVHGFGRHIRNFSIAIGTRMTYVCPRAGNEQALGRDYRDIPAQWPAVRQAVENHQTVLTGPVNLVQGGTGLIYRVPVIVEGKYWGLLSTVIDIPSLHQAVFEGMEDKSFEFTLRSEERNGAPGGILWGRPELFADPATVQLKAEMPSGTWTYAVRNNDKGRADLAWTIRSIGWLLAVLGGLCVFTVLRQRSEMARLAGFDSLTELPNRRLFDDRLEQSIRRLMRRNGGQIAVIFIDLNGFKPINDRYGHKFGDRVLHIFATRLQQEVRLADTVSRWAGDEFAILIEDADEALLARVIERLRKRASAAFEIDGLSLHVGAAIGAALYPAEAATPAALIELADRRMYEDKDEKRD
ncbi:diguanylate cyclase domain-containing protein [Propionivibrio limicola]|uniref:diguanylate cyclase domain-containing protein n=1 Tax=Propionivibrio limicola TaxID=167645 RepID=UPI0014782B05|nr:diguanylate cyclase [Propionivibrio limicola]